jgi:hypothetical protein
MSGGSGGINQGNSANVYLFMRGHIAIGKGDVEYAEIL